MCSLGIVEAEVRAKPSTSLASTVVDLEIDLFVVRAAPQLLGKHGVYPASTPVHADLDILAFEHPRERGAGEWAALIGVEYRRCAISRVPSAHQTWSAR